MEAHKQELSKIPVIEEKLTTISQNMEGLQAQVEKTHQLVMIFMETVAKERLLANGKGSESPVQTTSTMKSVEGESSGSKETRNDMSKKKVDDEGENNDQSKFKRVEMPVFNGDDPDSWLFQADRYFQIHKLTNSERLIVATISFEGPTLNWYRAQEERDKFIDWLNLKERLLLRFRFMCEGSLYGCFLRIQQDLSAEEYRNLFDKWMAPLADIQEKIVEETFMGGL